MNPKLTEQCVKNLVFIGRAMHLNPELCFAEDAGEEEENASETESPAMDEASDSEGVDDDGGDAAAATDAADSSDSSPAGGGKATAPGAADPLRWVFNRMSHMVVHKGEARRRAVFSWFLAMVAVHDPAVSVAHLKLMLLPLRRAVLDAEAGGVEHKAGGSHAGGGGGGGSAAATAAEKEQSAAELATEVSGEWRSKEEVPECGCQRVQAAVALPLSDHQSVFRKMQLYLRCHCRVLQATTIVFFVSPFYVCSLPFGRSAAAPRFILSTTRGQ